MDLESVMPLMDKISGDQRVNVWHLGIYTAIILLWYKGSCKNPVAITRRKVMGLAHVASIVTYHKCIRELEQFGYIRYMPSFHPVGSQIFLK